MQVDRFFMERGECARVVDFSDDARVLSRLHYYKIVRADAAQGDRVRRIGVVCPVPFLAAAMNETALGQIFQNFGNVVFTEFLVNAERQFESRTLEMADQNVNVFRINQALLRRLMEEVIDVVDDVLIEWCARRDHYCDRTSGAT